MVICRLCHSKKTYYKYKVAQYSYYQCINCSTLFLYPAPKNKFIDSFYTHYPYSTGYIERVRIKKRADIILKNLISLNPKGKTLFDIGTGYGYFLEKARQKGLKVSGIEPSSYLFKATTHILKGNATISQLTFEKYYIHHNNIKFDFITITHVIEHDRNPKKMINNALSLLNPNGILYIETPNLNSWLAKIEKEKYTFLTPPDHLWIFSKKSFEHILKKSQIVKLSTYSYPEHLMGIIKRKNKIKFNNKNLPILNSSKKSVKQLIKYIIFDKIIAPIFTSLLNFGDYGSILELYIKLN